MASNPNNNSLVLLGWIQELLENSRASDKNRLYEIYRRYEDVKAELHAVYDNKLGKDTVEAAAEYSDWDYWKDVINLAAEYASLIGIKTQEGCEEIDFRVVCLKVIKVKTFRVKETLELLIENDQKSKVMNELVSSGLGCFADENKILDLLSDDSWKNAMKNAMRKIPEMRKRLSHNFYVNELDGRVDNWINQFDAEMLSRGAIQLLAQDLQSGDIELKDLESAGFDYDLYAQRTIRAFESFCLRKAEAAWGDDHGIRTVYKTAGGKSVEL